jgi:hypothetical protein
MFPSNKQFAVFCSNRATHDTEYLNMEGDQKKRSKSSWTWYYFSPADESKGQTKATCKLCGAKITAQADKLANHLGSKAHLITKEDFEKERSTQRRLASWAS